MTKIWKLAVADFKLIFRDASLRVFLFLPLILFSLIIWVLPSLVDQYDFLIPYISVVLMVAAIENTQTFCIISSMVLIDEKESDVAKVYGIVPLSKMQYLISRFSIPYLFTVVLNVLLLEIQSFYKIPFGTSIILSLLMALIVPLYVLGINAIVKNRMQGMVYIKAFNMIVLAPVIAFFVPENVKFAFSILPTFWIFQSLYQTIHHLSMTLSIMFAFIYLIVSTYFVSKLFFNKHFR